MKKNKPNKASGKAPEKKSAENERISEPKSTASSGGGRESSRSDKKMSQFRRQSRPLKKLTKFLAPEPPPELHDGASATNETSSVNKIISTKEISELNKLVVPQPSSQFLEKLPFDDSNANLQRYSSIGFDISPQDWKKGDVELINTLNVSNNNNSVIVYPAKLIKRPAKVTANANTGPPGEQDKSPPPASKPPSKQNKGVSPSPPTKQKKNSPTPAPIESDVSNVTFDEKTIKEPTRGKFTRKISNRRPTAYSQLLDDDELPPAPSEFADKRKGTPSKNKKKNSKDSNQSRISTGPTIEDDRTAGKRKPETDWRVSSGSDSHRSEEERRDSGNSGSKGGSKKNYLESKGKTSGSKKQPAGSQRDSAESKGGTTDDDYGIRVTAIDDSRPGTPQSPHKETHQAEFDSSSIFTEGSTLPRTPPEMRDNSQECQMPTNQSTIACDPMTNEEQSDNKLPFDLPPPVDCNNPVLVQANRIECFPMPEKNPCYHHECQHSPQRRGRLSHRGCGGCSCCSCNQQAVCFTPCSCQRCRVFHYCFNILNRHTLKPEEMYLGISQYEQNVIKSFCTAGQNQNYEQNGEAGNYAHPMDSASNQNSSTTGQNGDPTHSQGKLFGEGPYSLDASGKTDRWKTEYTSKFTDFSNEIRREGPKSRYPNQDLKHG